MAQYTSTHTGAQIDTAVTDVLANSSTWTGKQDKLTVNPATTTSELSSLTIDGTAYAIGGKVDDVQINGTSIVSSKTANFLTNTAYSSTNKIATMSDITKTNVGLGNVENTALSTWAGTSKLTTCSQGTFGSAAVKGVDTSIASGTTSTNLPTSAAVYNALHALILTSSGAPSATPTYYPAICIDTSNYILYAKISSSASWTALGAVYKG